VKLKTTTLKRGLLLYHGTSSPDFDERADSLTFPAWFSEKKRVARYFVNWHGEPEPYPYNEKLPNSARIITYRVAEPIKVLLIREQRDMVFIADEFGINTDDAETFAEWVCTNGYNGWIIPNNYPAEGGSDIMLCHAEGLEYVETEALNEDLKDADDMAGEFKEISGSDPLETVYNIIEQAGVTDIMVKRSEGTTTFTGELHSDAYPHFTQDGTKIEVADLCYAQQIVQRIKSVKGVERASCGTKPPEDEGYASPWRRIRLWVMWTDLKEMKQQASEIVNILVEANSAHLEMAMNLARKMIRNSAAQVAAACLKALRDSGANAKPVKGYAVFREHKIPHVWLKVDGQEFDPFWITRGKQPESYESTVNEAVW